MTVEFVRVQDTRTRAIYSVPAAVYTAGQDHFRRLDTPATDKNGRPLYPKGARPRTGATAIPSTPVPTPEPIEDN